MNHSIKNNRKVNIEILRILSMLLVMVIHYNVPINGQTSHEMLMAMPMKTLGVTILKSLSFLCVNSFILISGYFGIHWKWKSICNYLFQIFIWSIFVYFICVIVGVHCFNVKSFIHQVFFCLGYNWFFTVYLGLYMMAPVLNKFIEHVEEKQLATFLIVYLLYQTIFGYILKNRYEFNQGLTIMSFIGLYLIGSYLRKTTLGIFKLSANKNLLVYLTITFLLVIISITANFFGFNKDIFSYINPFVILQTVFLFLFFRELKIKNYEKIILFFSSSSFAGLLIHSFDGGILYNSILYKIDNTLPLPFIFTMLFIVSWFTFAVLLDKIRILIFKLSFRNIFEL